MFVFVSSYPGPKTVLHKPLTNHYWFQESIIRFLDLITTRMLATTRKVIASPSNSYALLNLFNIHSPFGRATSYIIYTIAIPPLFAPQPVLCRWTFVILAVSTRVAMSVLSPLVDHSAQLNPLQQNWAESSSQNHAITRSSYSAWCRTTSSSNGFRVPTNRNPIMTWIWNLHCNASENLIKWSSCRRSQGEARKVSYLDGIAQHPNAAKLTLLLP